MTPPQTTTVGTQDGVGQVSLKLSHLPHPSPFVYTTHKITTGK